MFEDKSKSIIRRAKISDISKLISLYMGLSVASRKLFHPFPFNKTELYVIFLGMIVSGHLLTFIRGTMPRLGFLVLIAEDQDYRHLMGFTYLSVLYKDVNGFLVANRGIVTREGTRMKGIGTALDSELIRIAKNIGVAKFSVTAIEYNHGSIALHKKMGYQIIGRSHDTWNNVVEDALVLELELK